LLRGSVTPEQEKVARNLIGGLRNVEHLWLGHPHPDDYLRFKAQTSAPTPMPQPTRRPIDPLVGYIGGPDETQEEADERQRIENEANAYGYPTQEE
jgi:hypothetical protein